MISNSEHVARAIEEHGGPPKHPTTFIYFVQAAGAGGPIKIGRARDPLLRLASLQTGNPFRLALTRVVVADEMEETRLHALFAEWRLEGEWFLPHPTIAAMADAEADETLTEAVRLSKQVIAKPMLRRMREVAAANALVAPHPSRGVPLPTGVRVRTVTFRPTPEGSGWRESSADAFPS